MQSTMTIIYQESVVYVCHVCTCVSVCVHASMCACRGQRMTGVLLYDSQTYSFEAGSVPELRIHAFQWGGGKQALAILLSPPKTALGLQTGRPHPVCCISDPQGCASSTPKH